MWRGNELIKNPAGINLSWSLHEPIHLLLQFSASILPAGVYQEMNSTTKLITPYSETVITLDKGEKDYTMDSLGNLDMETLRSPKVSPFEHWDIPLAAWLTEELLDDGGGRTRTGFFLFCDLNHCNQTVKSSFVEYYSKFWLSLPHQS